jgi:tetratricopeptide (TPR) repeat protein
MTSLSAVRIPSFSAALLFGCVCVCSPTLVRAQGVAGVEEQVNALRVQIAAAETQHTPAGALGQMWSRLGALYHSEIAIAAEGDAYARAVPLLRTSGLELEYADALHALGTVYLSTERPAQARKCFVTALAVYENRHDVMSVASLHQALGLERLVQAKFKEAKAEFTESLMQMNAAPHRQAEPLMIGYLMRARAEYTAGESTAALDDVARARAAALELGLTENSLERISISMMEGAALTRLGQAEAGDAAIQEALRVAASQTDLAPILSVKFRMGVLREYAAALEAVHRKADAKRINAEVAKLQAQLPAACAGCTVSVAALRVPGL